jgi:cobalt-zinc-cadmium resistance protein CzcA
MINRIVEFAVRQRAVVLVTGVLLAILGADAFRRLPIEAYPDVADTWVQVIAQWPGHAAEEIERQITIPVERVLGAVPRKAALRSVSIAGLGVVTVLFEDGTDTFFARQQVNERLGGLELPEGASLDLGPPASPIGEIMRYRLVNCATTRAPECGDEDVAIAPRPLTELVDLQTWVLERELLAVPGVADVIRFGGATRQYQVLVDPLRLAAHKLTFEDVERALEAANGNAGGGIISFGRAALNVRGIGLLRPDQIGEVALATRGATPVRVRDVATVQAGARPRLGRVSVDDDKDVVAATILLRKGEAAEGVLKAVHARIADVNARVLPRGVKVSAYHDRTDLMHLTTHTVLHNLVEGIALVTLILFFFLGNARAALIAALTIPLSLLFAFIFMDRAKIPANLLSIGAIDFGMIVDGAIVVTENIVKQLAHAHESGAPVDVSAVVRRAAREVARPMTFAVAVIVMAYLPIFTLERVEGKLFSPMAWTVAFALAGALMFALTIVPALAAVLFKRRLTEREPRAVTALRARHLPLLGRLLRRPRVVVVAAIAIVAVDAVLASRVGSEFLPHLDEGAIWMRAVLPSNVSLEEAEALVDGVHTKERDTPGIREIVGKYPEIDTMAVQIGRPDDGTDPTGFYNAELLLVLRPRDEWRKQFHGRKDALIEALSRDVSVLPGVSFGFSQPIADNVEEALTGVKGQLAVKIAGDDLNALDDLADKVARTIRDVPGVVDLGIFRELGQSNLHVEIDRRRAERYGLTVAQVEDVVEKGIGGRPVTQIIEGERRHDLVARWAAEQRDSVESIRRLLIPVEGGALVPLSQVADVKIVGGASRIYREGGRRYIAIKLGVRGRDLGSTVAEAQRRVAAAVRLPAGYTMTWGGEFESARRAGRRLAIVIPATLVAIFVFLFAMFGRAREALIILGNVLLTSPVGGLMALILTGMNFSVSSGVGFLALFGVSVQTGVLLVAFATDARRRGAGVDEAILAATSQRLRPILMTALVATLGLLPAALSTGIGSDSQKPLAVVVVGGLFSSLTLSLFVLPLLLKLFAGPPPAAPTAAAPPTPPHA